MSSLNIRSMTELHQYQDKNISDSQQSINLLKYTIYYMNGERESIEEKLSSNKPILFKQFPNKPLLSKSKIINFHDNQSHFEERCKLFIEQVYLLTTAEVQKKDVYLSKNTFISHNGQIYVFYSFDQQYASKLVIVPQIGYSKKIIEAFSRFFIPKSNPFKDHFKKVVYDNICQTICNLERQQKSQGYIWKVLAQLQGSKLFRQYCYYLKFYTAILARDIVQPANELKHEYSKLIGKQYILFQLLNNRSSSNSIDQCIKDYAVAVQLFLKYLQKENLIKITLHEKDLLGSLMENSRKCCFYFTANLRKYINLNKTSSEKSVEQQDPALTAQRKRTLQQIQELKINKNSINFTIYFEQNNYEITVIVEGISQWSIDQLYYYSFQKIWIDFVNAWHQSTFHCEEKSSLESYRPLKLQLFHSNKNIGFRERLVFTKRNCIIQEIIVCYDRINSLFILYENIFMQLYRLSSNLIIQSEDYITTIEPDLLISHQVLYFNQFNKKYTKFFKQLENISNLS